MNNKIMMQLRETSSCSYFQIKVKNLQFPLRIIFISLVSQFYFGNRNFVGQHYIAHFILVLIVPVSGLCSDTSYIYVIHRPRACAKPTALGTGFINIVI